MKTNRNIPIILFVITTGIFLLRIILAFKGHYLEQVSGSWAALAVDVSKGILYRPLFDEAIGTGGTRWMPLFFTLHGILIKITGDVLYTGLLLSLFSSLMLISAIIMLLRHYKTSLESSLVMITLLLVSNNLITAMTAVRGDILAAALNIWGVYFAITSDKKHGRIVLSCLFFSLTLMTKITSGFGITAVVIWLFFNKGKKSAFQYAAIFSAFTILFIITIQVISSGRFMEIFALCASGGATIVKMLKSPFNFINCLKATDTGSIVIFTAALAIAVYKGREIIMSQYALYMASTLAITVFIFGTEGIVGNHLIDIHIASVLVISGFIHEYKIDRPMVIKCSLVVTLTACIINSHSLRQDMKQKPLLISIKETAALINKPGSMISQNPWLPILMKRDVYMLDPWMIRLIDIRKPGIFTSFYKRLDNGGYDLIVFDQDPLTPWIPEWFDYSHYGKNFMNHVFTHYRFRENYDNFYIYIPGTLPGSR